MSPGPSFSSRFLFADFVHLFLEALAICLVGAFFGVLLHHPLLWKVVSGQSFSQAVLPMEERHPGEVFLVPVAVEEVAEMAARGAVLVDARPRELYREEHIRGAVSLPLAKAGEEVAAFRKRFPVTVPVIVYCSGYGCRDSHELGARLIAAGYGEVLVYEGGFPEWRDQGLPLGRGDGP